MSSTGACAPPAPIRETVDSSVGAVIYVDPRNLIWSVDKGDRKDGRERTWRSIRVKSSVVSMKGDSMRLTRRANRALGVLAVAGVAATLVSWSAAPAVASPVTV